MNFTAISNRGKKLKIYIMFELSDDEAQGIEGGVSACATHIAFSATIGGLFGGVGAAVGALVAATGPGCLGLW
jgi:hypothetical protein